METEYTTVRLTKHISQRLKILAAIRGERMGDLVERLIEEYATSVTFSLPAASTLETTTHEKHACEDAGREEVHSRSA
jgi:hypothetical protein